MKQLAWAVAVFAAAALTYLPSVRYEFVSHDDHEYAYWNPNVLGGLSVSNVYWAVTSCGYACNWHPLAWTSLQLDASIAHANPVEKGDPHDPPLRRLASVMHAHNVVLHAANAALLFLLIVFMRRRLGSDGDVALPVATLFALVWAIHPLRTEVVCWVSERKEILSVFWMLVTLLLWTGGRSAVRVGLAFVCFALALSAKPVAVSLPVVLLAWDWVMEKRRFGRSLAAVSPFLVLAAGASALTLAAQTEAVDVGNQYTAVDKVVMSLTAPVVYLRQTVWPSGLSAFYPWNPPVSWLELGLGVVLLLGAVGVCAAWLWHRRSPALSLLAFAVAWCHVSLVSMLGIVKVGSQTHSDRYTYWAGCGAAAVAALAASRIVRGHQSEMTRGLATVVAALVAATLLRMPVWRNSYSLYADAVPKSWAVPATQSLCRMLMTRGDEGCRQAERLLRDALMQTGDSDIRAEFALLKAVTSVKSEFCLGDKDPAFGEARYEAETVLAALPNHPVANEALAVVEMNEGKWQSALRHLEAARKKTADVARIDRSIAFCREKLSTGK